MHQIGGEKEAEANIIKRQVMPVFIAKNSTCHKHRQSIGQCAGGDEDGRIGIDSIFQRKAENDGRETCREGKLD